MDRFIQVKPKLLFSVNAVIYNGKTYDHLGKVKTVAQNLPELVKTIVIPFVETNIHPTELPTENADKWFFHV